MKQKLKEYCDWLEDLTIAGDTINSKGLQKWITEYAKEYHTKQLALTDASSMFSAKQMEEAWTNGCGCGESRSGYFDIENYS
jgi:hypothetical protein